MENVWWLPFENSDTSVAVSNTTSGAVTVTLTIDGTSPNQSQPTQITLNPWQTRRLDIMDDIVGHHGGYVHDTGGISITHTGAPGAILARMFISKPNKGYSAAINFIDPNTTVSQKWSGDGLRFKNFNGADLDPVLVARNNGSQTSHVTGKIIYTAPNGTVQTINIPQFTVSGGSTREVDLDDYLGNVPATVGYGGLELNYDTPKGTVVTSVQSVSNDGNHVFQVPMADPQNIPSGSAGFPWKADGDFRTVVYIKNESDTIQKYVTHLIWDGGQYSDGEREIKPHQTIAVDFRKLRDDQTPDGLHRMIPLNLTKAQIAWSIRGGQNKTLSFRSEQSSLSGGIASNYACANCACPNRVLSGYINPVSIDEIVGQSIYLTGVQTEENCYGTQFSSAIQNITWSSSNSGIETVNSTSGFTQAVSSGTTTIYAAWDRVWYLFGPDVYCDPVYYHETLSAPVAVRPTIDSIGNAFGPVGTNFMVTIAGTGFRANVGGVPKTSFSATGSGVTFSNVSVSANNLFLATATVTIAANATEGSRTVSVTVTPPSGPAQTSTGDGNKAFFVQIPKKVTPVASPAPTPGVIRLDPTAGNIVNGYGLIEHENVCGGYRNFGFTLLDQSDNPILTPVSVTEILSNYSGTPTPGPSAASFPTVGGVFWDTHAVWVATGDGCPTSFSNSETQGFKVVIGTTTYPLSTTYTIASSRTAAGEYTFTATNTNP